MDGSRGGFTCEGNSGFPGTLEERCPRIRPVFDHLRPVKIISDKAVSEVRKDKQRRLCSGEGFEEDAVYPHVQVR